MRRSPGLALALPLALIAALTAAPAYAAQQSGLGTTLDVTIQPGTQSALEETAYLPVGGGTAIADTGDAVAADTTMTITEGATTLMSCTIVTGNTQCGDTVPAIDPGANNVVYTFDNGTSSVAFNGVLFGVTNVAPTVTLEWQDADGDWIDGSAIGIPLFSSAVTTARCTVTNNGNAPATLAGATGTVGHPSASDTIVPLSGTIASGATQSFPLWTGTASGVSTAGCSVPIDFPASSGSNGNGTGGGVILIGGTITTSALAIPPGGTVSVAGAGLMPPINTTYHVTVNGAPAPGSPVTITVPAGEFDLDVVFPTAGTYTLAVHNDASPTDITFATFTVTVGVAEIADTGADENATLAVAGLLVLAGSALLVLRRRF